MKKTIIVSGPTNGTLSGSGTNIRPTPIMKACITNHVKIAIADYDDARYDAAVFIKAQIRCA